MAQSFETLAYETLALDRPHPHVLRVTLNRPEAGNATNTRMGQELWEVFRQFYIDFDAARCIIVTGAGKLFCGGGDLKERDGMTDAAWQRQHALFEQAFMAIVDCPIPVIAAVNGHAYGGGTEMALCCDFIYAAEHARMALPEVTRGIFPGGMGTQNLPRACGPRRAKEIILTGAPFTAAEGYDWGIVNKVCPADRLMDEALATAIRIAENAPVAVRGAKKSIDRATEVDRKTGYAFEIEAYNRTVPTEDRREGVRSFVEKRKPNFEGR